MIAKQPDGSHGPLFTEMILYLNPYRAQIDADITENGVSTDAFASRTKLQLPLRSLRADTNMAPRYNNRFQAYRNDRFTDNLQVNNINTNSEGYQPRYQPRPSTSRGGPRNKYINTMYCSLCSGTSHTAAMGCYKIKDDSGKSILISPTQIPCNICEKVLQKKLFHPVKFCFNRKATATGSYEKTNRFWQSKKTVNYLQYNYKNNYSQQKGHTLSGGNTQPLGKKSEPPSRASSSIVQNIIKTQIWKNPTETLAVRALNISALSILKTIAKQTDPNHKLFLMNREPLVDQKIGKKVFIKLYLQTGRWLSTSLLLDSGSDISLIHERELHKLVTPTEIHKYKSVNKHKVETFSNQVINILYNVTLPWSSEKHGPTINLTFSVYDQEVTHSLLFGQDNMQKMGMILSYAPG